jgi:hypothetical protein
MIRTAKSETANHPARSAYASGTPIAIAKLAPIARR